MDHSLHVTQDALKKRNRPNAHQHRHRREARSPIDELAIHVPHGVAIDVSSLKERLCLKTKDADFSAVWLTRDELGMAFLDQLGLMDMIDLLELSKSLSKIGAIIFERLWLKLRTLTFLPLSSINMHLHHVTSNNVSCYFHFLDSLVRKKRTE
jgi:hypothetical protein